MLPSNIELLKHLLDETTFILNAVVKKSDEQIVKTLFYLEQLLEA